MSPGCMPNVSNRGSTYAAPIKQEEDWWIGWIEEVLGVNEQDTSKAELLVSLRTTLREALEFNREDARRAAVSGFIEEPLMV